MRPTPILLAALALALSACTAVSAPESTSRSIGASASERAGESSAPSVSSSTAQRHAVDADGRELVILCEGEGTPTVILEDGHPSETGGIARFSQGPLWDALTAETRVCAYDRAGWGQSDPAPNKLRTADDVVDDLQALLGAAGETGPFILAGSSFGGFIVTYFAAREPDDVAGVILLDVPAPDPTLTLDVIPEIAWDHPANPEHVDAIGEFESRFGLHPEPMQAPLVILTGSHGASDLEDQSFWLQVSPDARQVELAGGHSIDFDNPTGVIEQILAAVEAAR